MARHCKEWVRVKEEVVDVPLFNEIFLESIKKFGRLHDTYLVRNFNLRSGSYFKDMLKGPIMFLKGKLHLVPDRVKNLKEVRRIFDKVREIEGER
jgi:heterodisulfide reductase subunit C